ncbi:MAG: prepilin peptidase [Candidatus Diapherotrites archaeon]|nr:prepilin peptidase [Candidatus Diapherotrites archaeon]
MFQEAAIIVSIAGLIGATYTDLKERIVPNKLNYGLGAAGLAIYSAQSLFEASWNPIFYSIIGLATGFAFGWLLWKLGVFAGGDVKLFAGLGALNPLTPALAQTINLFNVLPKFYSLGLFFFPITLFIYSLISFLPYGLVVIFFKLSKNKPFQKKLAKEVAMRAKQAAHFSLFAAAAYTLIYQMTPNPLLALVAVIAWGLLGKHKKFATILALLWALAVNYSMLIQNVITLIIISIIGYGTVKLLFSLRALLSKKVAVAKLEEGMIPANSFLYSGKKIVMVEPISIEQIIRYAKEKKLVEMLRGLTGETKEIISSKKARGMTLEEIHLVKKLAKEGRMPRKITVKDSMPFVPTMLIGYFICLLIGDFFLMAFVGGIL